MALSILPRLLALALLALPVLAAPAAAAGIPSDVVVMAKQIGDIVSLDPAEVYELSGAEVVGNLYDRLLDYDVLHPGRVEPALAESWSADSDGRTYHFTLRPGTRFASGDPLTAADVAFSLQRAVRLDLTPAVVLRQFGFTAANVAERIRAPDPRTVVIETAESVAPSLVYDCLGATVASVVERAAVQAHAQAGDLGHQWLTKHSAGSGPYRLKIWRPGERYALVAVPGYWGGAPKNREVIVLNIVEPATQRLMLARGDVDYARDLDQDQIAALSHDPGIVFDRALQDMLTYLAFNQRNPYLRRPQVVEALKYLVDYRGIARNLLGGTRVVHQTILPDGMLGASDAKPFAYDPARAMALLAAAGLRSGFATSLDTVAAAPEIDIAQALQASFAAAGVRLTILPGDGKAVLTKYRARRHDIYLGEWGSDYPDPESNAQAFLTAGDLGDDAALRTVAWRNSWQDKALAARVAAAARQSDLAARAALYQGIERDAAQAAPYAILFQEVAVAAHHRRVSGLVLGASPARTRYAGILKN